MFVNMLLFFQYLTSSHLFGIEMLLLWWCQSPWCYKRDKIQWRM